VEQRSDPAICPHETWLRAEGLEKGGTISAIAARIDRFEGRRQMAFPGAILKYQPERANGLPLPPFSP
jgi:hypothetical protein